MMIVSKMEHPGNCASSKSARKEIPNSMNRMLGFSFRNIDIDISKQIIYLPYIRGSGHSTKYGNKAS